MSSLDLKQIIHVAVRLSKKGIPTHLHLKKIGPHEYGWFSENGSQAELIAPTAQDAIRLAWKEWKMASFRPLGCGFRYSLPERDEHGMNALFHEMIASYSSPTGVCFDSEQGYNYFVQAASQEALDYWNQLKSIQ